VSNLEDKCYGYLAGERHDLCNEWGDLLGIKDYKPTISGMTIFTQRETYFIVVIKRNPTGNEIEEIIPMLNPKSDIFDDLLKNIRNKNLPKRRSSTSKRRSSGSKNSLTLSMSSKTSSNSKGKRRSSADI
jgi:hypothetical protein